MESLRDVLTFGDWQLDATCANHEPELWWSDDPHSLHSKVAISICNTCPVRRDCLNHALALPEREGIWGGLTASARKAIRKHRLAVA